MELKGQERRDKIEELKLQAIEKQNILLEKGVSSGAAMVRLGLDGESGEVFFALVKACKKLINTFEHGDLDHSIYCSYQTPMRYCNCGLNDIRFALTQIEKCKKDA